MISTEQEYLDQLEVLRSQPFWKSWSNNNLRLIAAIALAAGGGGGGGGSGSATEITQLAILAQLQRHTTIQVVQNLAIGTNTIVHNLGLSSPFTLTKTIVDNATGAPIAVPISGEGANSFVITSPIAYSNVRITLTS